MSKQITLYTNHLCPWAHRAHIALAELGLDFKEEIIDLSAPRTKEYLAINPRGLVPTLKYGDEIIIESGIVTQFLADAYPQSKLEPQTGTPEAALQRARINVFVDTFVSKLLPNALYGFWRANSDEEREKLVDTAAEIIQNNLVPYLEDAAPFFGGSKELTLAEVNTASFVIRIHAFSKPEHGVLPQSFADKLNAIPAWKKWVDAVVTHPNVTHIFDEPTIVEHNKARVAKLQAEASKV